MKSKVIKLGGSVLGGSGIIALIMGLVSAKETSIKQYVDSKHEVAIVEIINLKEGIRDIKAGITRLENYLINKAKKENR